MISAVVWGEEEGLGLEGMELVDGILKGVEGLC